MSHEDFEIQKSNIEPEQPEPVKADKKAEEEIVGAIMKMYALLEKTGKNLREVIPLERNFEIELQESEAGVRIRLKHKESGEEKDLSVFLPPDSSFRKDEKFVYKVREKEICFSENEVQFRGFLLTLFHEIGHAHGKDEHPVTTWDTIKAAWHGIRMWGRVISKAHKEDRIREGEGKKYINRMASLPKDYLLPQWYLDKMSHAKAKSERNAWAFALRELRKLRQEGYDVFAGYKNTAQIRAYVGYCLYTYDTDLFMKKLISGDIGDIKDLQNQGDKSLFWKKSKLYNRVVLPDTESEQETE